MCKVLGCAVGLFLMCVGAVEGQALRGRISLQIAGSTIEKSVGPGLYVGAKQPLVGRLSLIGGGGLTAYILEGRRNGTYSFTPEVGLNFVIPSRSKGATTVFGGGGYHVPFGAGSTSGGPTVHLGIGRIRALQETTMFVNLSPTLVVRKQATALFVALRTGVVF